MKKGRQRSSRSDELPGNSGTAKEPTSEAPPDGPDDAPFKIATEWPSGPLNPKSVHPLRITIPSGLGWVLLRFEYNEEFVWVSGPGKRPGTREFVVELKPADIARTLELKLGIRSIREAGLEPIAVYGFNRDGRQLYESLFDLSLVPAPEPPSILRPVIETLLWLAGAAAQKPLGIRLLHFSLRLILLATVAAGYYFLSAPERLTQLWADMGWLPPHYAFAATADDARDPNQEFAQPHKDSVRQAWRHPAAWVIEPGFMSNDMDGKLRLIGPGAGTFPIRGAFYDFHITMAIELQPQGSASWIIRAQPNAGAPESIAGYHFELRNRGKVVYVAARAVGARSGIAGRTTYNLLSADERPLDLSASCCSSKDRIRVQIDVEDFKLEHRYHLQSIDAELTEFPAVLVSITDLRRAFRYGSFQIISASQGVGPAYEFIRLQASQ